MTLLRCSKMGLLINSQKGVASNNIVYFVVSESMTEVCPMPITCDCWYFYFYLYIFCNIFDAINHKNYFLPIPTDKKFFQNLQKQNIKIQFIQLIPVWKNVRNFLTQKICNVNSKKLHHKCIGLNPPLFPSDCGKFSFFIFNHFEHLKLILGDTNDPSLPSHCLSSF